MLSSLAKIICRALMSALLLGSISWAGDLNLVAVTASHKSRIRHDTGKWSTLSALALPQIKDRVEIDGRTEFIALYIDRSKTGEGQRVIFTWYHGTKLRLYAPPVRVRLTVWPGYDFPVAASAIWSEPSLSGRLMNGAGLGTLSAREDWEASRCFGPRTVKVTDGKGKVLAKRTFEIHQPGVLKY